MYLGVGKGYMVVRQSRTGLRSVQNTLFRSKSEAISNYLTSSGLKPGKMDRRERDRLWKSFRRNGVDVLSVVAVPYSK